MVEANVVGTMSLVDAALDMGFEAFVNAGSSSEYGFTDHPPTETSAGGAEQCLRADETVADAFLSLHREKA